MNTTLQNRAIEIDDRILQLREMLRSKGITSEQISAISLAIDLAIENKKTILDQIKAQGNTYRPKPNSSNDVEVVPAASTVKRQMVILNQEISSLLDDIEKISTTSDKYKELDAKLQVKIAKRRALYIDLAAEEVNTITLESGNVIPDPNIRDYKDSGPAIFSGCDIIPVITTENRVIELGNITTLSYSTHRDKHAVRTLGRTYARGYSRGGRTIAGTIVWTIFDNYALSQVAEVYDFESGSDDIMTTIVPDQLPPFDITVTYFNEVPSATLTDGVSKFRGAVMRLYGVEIVDEGQTHGVNDLYIENVMQFVARDIEHMTSVEANTENQDGIRRVTPFSNGKFQGADFSGDTSDNGISAKYTELSPLLKQFSDIQDILTEFDRTHESDVGAEAELIARAYNELFITTSSRDELIPVYIQIAKKINTLKKDIKDIKEIGQGQIRYKNITDTTGNLRDNPYDFFRPREL